MYICGPDTNYNRIRFIKCHPYDTTPVLIDKYITNDDDNVTANTVQSSMDSSGVIHLVFEKSGEIFHCTVDKDGNMSEFEQLSFDYAAGLPGIYASPNGKVHVVWAANDGVDPNAYWKYRVLSDVKWSEEEVVAKQKSSDEIFGLSQRTLWEDPNGGMYFSNSGWFYWYRDNAGWHDKVWVANGDTGDEAYDLGGGVTGDMYGNAMFVYGMGGDNEIKYMQLYGVDKSDLFQLTTGHSYYGAGYDFIRITTDKDDLAVIVWADQIPTGLYGIFARRQIME